MKIAWGAYKSKHLKADVEETSIRKLAGTKRKQDDILEKCM